MKVPLVLRSVIVILPYSFVIMQCFPLSRLSFMQIVHYEFLPMRIEGRARGYLGRGWVLGTGRSIAQGLVASISTVSVFLRDMFECKFNIGFDFYYNLK